MRIIILATLLFSQTVYSANRGSRMEDQNYFKIARELIKRHEGFSSNIYKCTAGKLTVGYGHNLEARPVSKHIAELMLDEDMKDFIEKANRYSWYSGLDDNRKAVIIDMMYNMGSLDDWRNFQDALSCKDWGRAVRSMQDSRWFSQVGIRATELCSIMLTGSTNGLE